jgi:hypothetical protein
VASDKVQLGDFYTDKARNWHAAKIMLNEQLRFTLQDILIRHVKENFLLPREWLIFL